MGSEEKFPSPSVRGFFGGGGGGSWGSLVLGWVAPGWLAGGVPSLLRSFVFFCVFCVVSVFSFLFFATCLEDGGEGGAPPHVDPLTIASHPDPICQNKAQMVPTWTERKKKSIEKAKRKQR